jgi:hypothetical protein
MKRLHLFVSLAFLFGCLCHAGVAKQLPDQHAQESMPGCPFGNAGLREPTRMNQASKCAR